MKNLIKFSGLILLILVLKTYCVSDYSESAADSCEDCNFISEKEKSEVMEDKESNPLFFDPNINKDNQNNNKKELTRLSSELIILSEEIKEVRKRLNTNEEIEKILRIQQIKDAIKHKYYKQKGWIKGELPKLQKFINLADKDGKTSLHLAIDLLDSDALKFLLICGADANIPNALGITAQKFIELLEKRTEEYDISEQEKKLIKAWNKYKPKQRETDNGHKKNKFSRLKKQFSQQIEKFKNLKKSKLSSSYEN